jgi:putative intracellular protease/amidase
MRGAEWRDEPYVLDENVLTGRTTNDLRAFTKQLNKHFTKLAQEIPSV